MSHQHLQGGNVAGAATRADRDRMVERYLPLADKLARRYSHTSEPLDDLIQVARLGLMKAADRFDPDRGLAFSTFAVPTITGELRRYFRDYTWTVRLPRDLQDLYLSAQRTREHMVQELGRAPTAAEVAQRLGRTTEDIVDALEAGDAHRPVSLDMPAHTGDGEGRTLADTIDDPRREIAEAEDAVLLAQLGSTLNRRDWELVRLRYQEGLLQREIAERVGCSQTHISRILSDAMVVLQAAAARPGCL